MSIQTLRLAAAVAAVMAAGWAGAGELAGGGSLDYPHAGIAITIPAGYQQQVVVEPFELAKAVLTAEGKPVQAVTVSALPLEDPSATPDDLAEGILASQSGNLAIRGMQVLSKAAMKAADMPGAARFISYTFRGDEMVAASAVFCRDLPERKARMQYVVTVEATAQRKGEVLPVLGEVVKSIRLLAVVRPIYVGVCSPGLPVEGPGGLYSLALPHGWHVQPSPNSLAIAQTDYLLGGLPGLSAYVVQADLPAATDAREHAQRCAEGAIESAKREGMAAALVSQGPAKLAGGQAWQIVFEQRLAAASDTQPASGATTSESASAPSDLTGPEPANVVFVQRSLAIAPGGSQGHRRCLSLVLVCPEAKPQAAEAVMEKLATGMAVRAATTAPTTQPAASAPAQSHPASPAGATPD